MENIKKFITEPYGSSLVALTMLDNNYSGIEMNIEFTELIELVQFNEQVVGIWSKLEQSLLTSFIRTYKKDGVFLKSFNDVELESSIIFPTEVSMYKNKRYIIDIEQVRNSYKYRIYKFGENSPRMLNITYVVRASLTQPTTVLEKI